MMNKAMRSLPMDAIGAAQHSRHPRECGDPVPTQTPALKSGKQSSTPQAVLNLSPLRRNADDINTSILNTVRAGSGAYFNVAERCAALKEKAGWISDFEHFRRLCLGDMRQAFDEGRSEGKQAAHNRKRTWLSLFSYCAARLKITRKLAIQALDRQGNYLCLLVDSDAENKEQAEWQEFLRLGRRFGIRNTQLETLRRVAEIRQARDEHKPEQRVGSQDEAGALCAAKA